MASSIVQFRPSPDYTGTDGVYTVQSGQTLSGIAQENGISLSLLQSTNPQIVDPNSIRTGQIIQLPPSATGYTSGSSSTSSADIPDSSAQTNALARVIQQSAGSTISVVTENSGEIAVLSSTTDQATIIGNDGSVTTQSLSAFNQQLQATYDSYVANGYLSQNTQVSYVNYQDGTYGILAANGAGTVITSTGVIFQETNGDIGAFSSTGQVYIYDATTNQSIFASENGSAGTLVADTQTVASNGEVIDDIQGYTAAGSKQYGELLDTSMNGSVSATISGSGDVANLSNASITLANGASATVNGSGNTITLADDGFAKTTITGDNNTIIAGKYDFFDVAGKNATIKGGTGDGMTVTGDNATVTTGGGGSVSVTGQGAAVTAGDHAIVTVNGDQASVTGASGASGMVVTATGAGERITVGDSAQVTLNGSGGTVTTTGGILSSVDVTGSRNTVNVVGSGALTVNGNSNQLTAGAGSWMHLSGTGTTVNVSNGQMWLAENSQASVTGNGNTIWTRSGDMLAVAGQDDPAYGDNSVINYAGANGGDFVSGSGDTGTNWANPPTYANQAVFGTNGVNNSIVGSPNDTIYAGNLNDTITAATADTLNAGAGVDTFVYNPGTGPVTLNDAYATKTAATNQDVIELGAGITAASTTLMRDLSNNLVLSFGNGDQLNIAGYFNGAGSQPTIVFADGTRWSSASLPMQPVLGATLAPQIVAAGTPWQFTLPSGLFTPVNNGDTLTYAVTLANGQPLPTWLTFDPVKQTFSGTPTDASTGSLDVAIVATESGLEPASTTLNLQVNPGYQAPTVTQSLANQTATAGSVFNMTLPAMLFNEAIAGDKVTLSATQANGNALPTWLGFDASTGTFSGTPTDQTTGSLALAVIATDAGGLNASTAFNLQVTPSYAAPTVTTPLTNQTASAGMPWSYALPASLFSESVAGDTLTYAATLANGQPLPNWLSFDRAKQAFNGTPTDAVTGPLALEISATDLGGLSTSTTFTLQVNPGYQAPTVAQTLAPQTIAAGTPWEFGLPAGLFSEAIAGDALTVEATMPDGTPLPSWLVFNPVNQTFSGTPTDQTTGALALTIKATDMGGLSTSTTLNVQVNPTWQAPTVTQTLPSQSVAAGAAWSYSLPASLFSESMAGDTLSYSATLADGTALPAWLSFDARNLAFSGTPPSGSTGTVALKITATDMGGLSASTALNIVETAPSTTPVVTQSLSSQTIAAGSAWSFALPNGLFSESAAGDTLAYTATLANGNPLPSWLSFNAASLTFSGTPTDQTTGAMQLKITATEQGGLSASAPLNVTVNPLYAAPTPLEPLFGMTVLGQPWQYTLPPDAFSEPVAGDTLTYSAKMADGSALPSWLTFDSGQQTFSGTPPGEAPSTLNMVITATDLGGLSSSTPLTVQLQQNVVSVDSSQVYRAGSGEIAFEEPNPYSNVIATDSENHTLLMTGAFDSAALGDGNNSVAATALYDTVAVGDGNNVLQLTGWNVTATLGNGDNTIIGSSGTITAGNGNNIITTANGSARITVGDGANEITTTGSFTNVYAGNGNNVISANGAFETVTVGDGVNTIVAKGYYEFVTLGNGTDTVSMTENTTATVGHGTYLLEDFGGLRFGADTASDHLWFQQVGQDLLITEVGVGGTVTAKNWFAPTPEQAFGISAGDGKSLSRSGVDQLVQAMAGFAPPAPGATSFTAAEQQTLAPVLAANWR
jgi:LysM repeat protein